MIVKKARTGPPPTTFYEMSARILELYRKELLEMPRIPLKRALLEGKNHAGIYLMFDLRGQLWNVGKAVDLRARLQAYRSANRAAGRSVSHLDRHKVAFLEFPPKAEWPRGMWKNKLYRLEWFVQLALEIPGSMNSLYREDPELFHGTRSEARP
jgi:hypothetical protein